jgi:ABC-type sugar transport system ATPase subunit
MRYVSNWKTSGRASPCPGLEGIDLEVRSGEIHAIIGENGAGKSTLMNIFPACTARRGRMFWEGKEIAFKDTKEAQSYGIAMIHQELSLMPHLSVAENIYIGRRRRVRADYQQQGPLCQNRGGSETSWSLRLRAAYHCRGSVNLADAACRDREGPLAQREAAYHGRTDLLPHDPGNRNPSRSHARPRAERVSILFISHRIGEVFSVANRLTILRDGKLIATKDRQDASIETVLSLMVGREFNKSFHRNYRGSKAGETPALEARNISSGKAVRNVSLSVYPGEVLALTGLVGAGRTETVETIFGARNRDSGEILVDGKKADIGHPADAVGLGMGLVPEGRKIQGIFPQRTVLENMTVARLPAFVRGLFVRSADERKSAESTGQNWT